MKKSISFPVGIVLIVLVSFLGLRECSTGGVGGESPSRAENGSLVRRGERSRDKNRSEAEGNFELYSARLRKGISVREIRWILEDFRAFGLDLEPGVAEETEYFDLRRKQHDWYEKALVDGLHLDADQEVQVRDSLKVLRGLAINEFRTSLGEKSEPFEASGKLYQILDPQTLSRLIRPQTWLADEAYAPWNLCKLTEEQLGITWCNELMDMREGRVGTGPMSGMGWHSAVYGQKTLMEGSEISLGEFPTGTYPIEVQDADNVFPFAGCQEFVYGPEGQSEEVVSVRWKQWRSLHPAQFRMLLLERAEVSRQVGRALEHVAIEEE